MNLLSATSRRVRKERRLKKSKALADWKTGRETHQVTMTPQAWYNVNEICKADGISYGQLFEELIQSFMRWFVKETRKRNISNSIHAIMAEANLLSVIFNTFWATQMEFNLFKRYHLDSDSMPLISDLPNRQQPISIEVEQAAIYLLTTAISKRYGIIHPNISNAIEQAILLYVENLENESIAGQPVK